MFRPLEHMIYVFRLITVFAHQLYKRCLRFPNMSEKCSLVDPIFMSQRRDPRQYLQGEPRVQFHLNRRFLARKLLSGTTGEGRSLTGT